VARAVAVVSDDDRALLSGKESKAEREARTVGWRVRDGARGWMRSAVSGNPIQCGPYPEPVALAVARDVIVASRSTTARPIRVLRARPSAALANAVEERDAACVRTTVVEARVRVVEAERDEMVRLVEHWRERWHREVGVVEGERDGLKILCDRLNAERNSEHEMAVYWAVCHNLMSNDRGQWQARALRAEKDREELKPQCEAMEARVGALRAALIATINACPGAGATDAVSDDFLMRAPDEVRGQFAALTKRVAALAGLALATELAAPPVEAAPNPSAIPNSSRVAGPWSHVDWVTTTRVRLHKGKRVAMSAYVSSGRWQAWLDGVGAAESFDSQVQAENHADSKLAGAGWALTGGIPPEAEPNSFQNGNNSPLAQTPSPSPIAPPSSESASPDDAGAAGASADWVSDEELAWAYAAARGSADGGSTGWTAMARGIRAVVEALDAAKVRT